MRKPKNKACWKWLSLLALVAGLGGAAAQGLPGGVSERGTAPSPWSAALSLILNPERDVSSRFKAVHALRNDLTGEEVSVLCRFIKARPGAREKNLPALQLIKNDLMNALMEQGAPSAELTDTIIATYQDRGQDLVTRDYALQHLVTWYEQGAAGALEAKSRMRRVLWEAVAEDTSMAGTALLGLHRLAAGDAAFNRAQISSRALAMVRGSQTPEAARITAIQVCAEEQVVAALPIIRSLAFTGSPTALRISAIAALGRLGGAEDILTLKQLETDSDPGLRVAIESALRRLQHEIRIQKVV